MEKYKPNVGFNRFCGLLHSPLLLMGAIDLALACSWRSPMTAIIQAVSRLTRTDVDAEPLKTVLVFSGIGLLLSLLAIETYGLDLSAGFF